MQPPPHVSASLGRLSLLQMAMRRAAPDTEVGISSLMFTAGGDAAGLPSHATQATLPLLLAHPPPPPPRAADMMFRSTARTTGEAHGHYPRRARHHQVGRQPAIANAKSAPMARAASAISSHEASTDASAMTAVKHAPRFKKVLMHLRASSKTYELPKTGMVYDREPAPKIPEHPMPGIEPRGEQENVLSNRYQYYRSDLDQTSNLYVGPKVRTKWNLVPLTHADVGLPAAQNNYAIEQDPQEKPADFWCVT